MSVDLGSFGYDYASRVERARQIFRQLTQTTETTTYENGHNFPLGQEPDDCTVRFPAFCDKGKAAAPSLPDLARGARGIKSRQDERKKVSGANSTLKSLLDQVDDLARETRDYRDKHINQNYRRINAELSRLMCKLDHVDVHGDENAAACRKGAIVKVQMTAKELDSKITHDRINCPHCFKLR